MPILGTPARSPSQSVHVSFDAPYRSPSASSTIARPPQSVLGETVALGRQCLCQASERHHGRLLLVRSRESDEHFPLDLSQDLWQRLALLESADSDR